MNHTPEMNHTSETGKTPETENTPEKAAVKKRGKPLKAIGIVVGVLLGLFAVSLGAVFPKQREMTVELGGEVSQAPSDYLFGYPFIIDSADVDTGGVITDKVGDYQTTARLLFYHYTFDVRVRDTTPPEIVPLADELYIASGRDYRPDDFMEQARDLSGKTECRIAYGGKTYDTISFPLQGKYRLTLEAEDASGNVGTREIDFTVDDPPVIIGAFDRHLPVGTDFDVASVAAVDTGDGNLTNKIQIERGGFDPDREGNYTVTYTVADSHGLATEKTVTYSVCQKEKLALYSDDLSLGGDELKLLCDADYFAYEPLAAPDFDKAVKLLEPTLVDLKVVWENAWIAGSGCIYKITPDYVCFLSVKHVMVEVYKKCAVMFFDGTVVKGKVDYVYSKTYNELAMFMIPTADIPTDTLMKLRQVYVDPDIYNKLQKDDEVVAYAKHWIGSDEDLVKKMKVKRLTTSIRELNLYRSLLETTTGVVGGMSGTAVVDLRGNLVGLASAIGLDSESTRAFSAYHSKIDVIPEVEAYLEEKKTDSAA